MAAEKIISPGTKIVDTIIDCIMTNTKQVILGILTIALCIGIFFAYRFWSAYREGLAQREFGALVEKYTAYKFEKKDGSWDDLFAQFQDAYNKHSGSRLAPYFLAYQANIENERNNKENALVLLDKAITQLGSLSAATFYKLERALIKLDMNDEIQKNGIEELTALAHDTKNIFHDTALFYLGFFYWSRHDSQSARVAWQLLVNEQRDEKLSPSPWVSQAEEYLKVMIV